MTAELSYKVKFPCGYEIEMEFKKGPFDSAEANFDEKEWKNCPLHGKKCPIKEE